MKKLLIFIDMFRPNLLKLWEHRNPGREVDSILQKWGGTIYTNCYTPAPDTPRSKGCLWSSLYPKENGCDSRIKYPKDFLKHPKNNFLRVLWEKGDKLSFIINPSNEKIGELPEDFRDIAYYSNGLSLSEALGKINKDDNSLTYISIKDYHYLIDDWRARPEVVKKTDENIAAQLNLINEKIDVQSFDLVILFSDHGWTMATEKNEKTIEKIGDNRDKILMYIRRKNDQILEEDSRLCSIMDIGPTLADFEGISLPYKVEGLSLFSEQKHELLLVEDHKDFNVTLSQAIEMWGVRYKNGLFICRNSSGEWEINKGELNAEIIKAVDRVLQEFGSSYEENIRAGEIIERYKDVKGVTTYFDGTPRKKHIKTKTKIKETVLRMLE